MTGCKKICYTTGPAFSVETPVEQAIRATGPPADLPLPLPHPPLIYKETTDASRDNDTE